MSSQKVENLNMEHSEVNKASRLSVDRRDRYALCTYNKYFFKK